MIFLREKRRSVAVLFAGMVLTGALWTNGCVGAAGSANSADSATPTTAPVSAVVVAPTTVSTSVKATVTFTATVAGTTSNKAVTWKAKLGAITAAGVYTAPPAAGTDTVTATSVVDAAKSGTAQIAVTTSTPTPTPAPPSSAVTSVTIAPGTASVVVTAKATFAATVAGSTTNKAVTWQAKLGTITTAGVYTAPAAAGADTVTATSVADTSKSGTAGVTVTAAASPSVTSVGVTPSTATSATNGTLQFAAAVKGGVTNTGVTWTSVQGKITASGLYTAPGNAGTDTVTATSDADPTKSGTATVTVTAPPASGALAAFPGAQGGGAASAGGRGGIVMEVTNTNDGGDGSLRECVQASGARTCVFRVAGIFTPQSQLRVDSPFLTIACQTAPGEVIIGGPATAQDTLFITTHDVTVRYCTFSADNPSVPSGPDTGTMNVEIANGDNYNIVLDHITSRWAGNKLWATLSNYVGPNRMITTQWSMFYEPHAGHPVGPGTATNSSCDGGSSNPCFSAGEHDIDFHHNLFADIHHRIPESSNYSTRFVNNIVFNWGYYASEWLGAMHVDEIGNKYVAGNLNSQAQSKEIHFTSNNPVLPGNPSAYLSGNIGPNQSNPSGNQYAMAAEVTGENGDEVGAVPGSWIRSGPLANTAFPIAADPVENLDGILTPTVGNSQHLDCDGNWVSHRDAADQRIIAQYKSGGSGGYWPNGITLADVSSIPSVLSGWIDNPVTRGFSACTESQHDGIPDQWKQARGLSTTDPRLYSAKGPNGYTYLENYMNGPDGSASLGEEAKKSMWARTSGSSGGSASRGSTSSASGSRRKGGL
jgi:hypothetical protein